MKSKESRATDEEAETRRLRVLQSRERDRLIELDYDNDRRGAIEAQRRKKRERLHKNTEES